MSFDYVVVVVRSDETGPFVGAQIRQDSGKGSLGPIEKRIAAVFLKSKLVKDSIAQMSPFADKNFVC